MQIARLIYGQQLPKLVDFAVTEVLGPEGTADEIKDLIDRRARSS